MANTEKKASKPKKERRFHPIRYFKEVIAELKKIDLAYQEGFDFPDGRCIGVRYRHGDCDRPAGFPVLVWRTTARLHWRVMLNACRAHCF